VSLYARLAAGLVILVLLAAGWHRVNVAFERADRRGYERRAMEDKAAADSQAASNRELQRASEIRYTVAAQQRERFIVTTVKELHEAAAPLAACPVPADAVRLLNAASACASGDSPAACGPGDAVPAAR
jgi:hypothetical protein